MTNPPTRPVRQIDPAPATAPASVVHPSWGVNVQTDHAAPLHGWNSGGAVPNTNALVASGEIPGGPAPRHRAPDDDEFSERDFSAEADEKGELLWLPQQRLVQSTPAVLIAAMFFITMCVLILTLARQPGYAALLAGLSVIIGAAMAVVFRGRWQ